MSLLNTIKFITDHPLNRDHKLSSIIRFAKWQVGSRLVPGAIVYDWVNGSKLLVKTGETGLTGNIYTGLHEFPDMGFLLHFLRTEDFFVDIGANAGSYTILACYAVGARGVAFEPVPSTYKRLVENMRLNHLDKKVKCINKGVGAQQGTIAFTIDSDTTNHALATGEQCINKVIIEVTSLDVALHGEYPKLIKIDVEGYETQVLEGAQEILKNQTLNAVIIELNGSGARYEYDESKILELMLSIGFRTYSYDPFSRKLINLDGKNLNSENTLFIRNKSLVDDRLRTATKVTVHGRQF
ncbi:MAG: FkbM family methyltransferase [Syntrophaceae bacterium]|nr:FkbM family methyltransferase [Syntrophaceae bacterium]